MRVWGVETKTSEKRNRRNGMYSNRRHRRIKNYVNRKRGSRGIEQADRDGVGDVGRRHVGGEESEGMM